MVEYIKMTNTYVRFCLFLLTDNACRSITSIITTRPPG